MSTLFRRTQIAAVLCATLTAPGISWSQEAESAAAAKPATSEPTLPEVQVIEQEDRGSYVAPVATVGGKTPAAVRDIPQTVTVINRAQLDSRAAASMKDALRYVPGITMSAGEGGQIGDNINLRGFSSRTDIFLDGLRDRGQYARDTFFLESLEVLKGPSSMLFGRGSTGGVINQVSKTPSLRQRVELSTTVGTDDYYRATADINQPLSKDSAARVAIMGQDIRTERDVVHNQDFGIAPSLRLGIGSPTVMTLSALLQNNNDIADFGSPLLTENGIGTVARPAEVPANGYYGYSDDYFDQTAKGFGITIEHTLSDNLSLRNRTQYSLSDTKVITSPLSVPTTGAVPTQRTPLDQINLSRGDRDREVTDTSLFNQTDLIYKTRTGPLAHTLVGGFEIGTDEFQSDVYSYSRAAGSPEAASVVINLANPVNGPRQGARFQSSSTRTTGNTVAVYLNDEVAITEQWKAVAGIRWDRYKADSTVLNFSQAGAITAPAQPQPRTDHLYSPRAGVIYQPSPVQSYYLSYGVSFNPVAESVTQPSGTSAPNASLAPEKNRSYELGGKWDLAGGDLMLNAALFRVNKYNARIADPLLGGLQSNTGEVMVEGAELGAMGRITQNWQLTAGYTWLDSEIVESRTVGTGISAGVSEQGKRYAHTPEHSATLWTSYMILDRYEIGGGVVYSSDRTLNNFETAMTEGYVRGDLMAAYRHPTFDVRVNLQNVTDERYFDVASAGRATLVQGRTALLTTTVRFGKS